VTNPFDTDKFDIFNFMIPLYYNQIECPRCESKQMIVTITNKSVKMQCGNVNCRTSWFYRRVKVELGQT